ncbi:MAG: helix-turn-helix domain-containing protein [Streptomycetaceae bacterium]|nr:helix-turn-helix domain-containing protein [Streptomycetaceae bacterium]NUS54759.1 helix-turn-helix domain-containing protein [Streptomycetaceae bacterium]
MTAVERPVEVDVVELAAEWRCKPETIRRYIAAGDLRAEKVAGRWLIARTDIDAYRKRQENVTRRRVRRPVA